MTTKPLSIESDCNTHRMDPQEQRAVLERDSVQDLGELADDTHQDRVDPDKIIAPESKKHRKDRTHKMKKDCFPVEGLGDFRRLPVEIRLNIWQHFSPEMRKEQSPPQPSSESTSTLSPSKGNSLAILQCSRTLGREISPKLYKDRTLHITIHPERRGWWVENLPGSTMRDFRFTPIHLFQSIRVEIYCTSRDDPGQMLHARAAVMSLVRRLRGWSFENEVCEPYMRWDDRIVLDSPSRLSRKRTEETSRVSKLQVIFLNTDFDTWQEGFCRCKSFYRDLYYDDDVTTLMTPFGYLRNVAEINFAFPDRFCKTKGYSLLRYLIKSIRYECSRPVFEDHPPDYEISQYAEDEAKQHIQIDFALDTLRGHTAAILRRERLIHGQWYQKAIEHRLKTYDSCQCFKWSTNLRLENFRHLDEDYECHQAKLQNDTDGKWRSFWPNGIPPLPTTMEQRLSEFKCSTGRKFT